MRKVAIILSAILLASSCTIKENRVECPCWLEVEVPGMDTLSSAVKVILSDYDGYYLSDSIVYDAAYRAAGYKDFRPKRGNLNFSAIRNASGLVLDGFTLSVADAAAHGIDYPQLWIDANIIDCYFETVHYTTDICKQYCRFTIDIDDTYSPQNGDLTVVVTGSATGIDVRTLVPLQGKFTRTLDIPADGTVSLNLPRQKRGDELTVSLLRDGVQLLSVPLKDIGFDWEARNLGDMYYKISTTPVESFIEIMDFETGETYSVVI